MPCQTKVGIYFAQSKNTIAISSNVTDSSEDDEDEESNQLEISNDGSLKKRKKGFSDAMDRKCLKIRKTFDSNVTIADEEDDNLENETQTNISLQSCQQKIESGLTSHVNNKIKIEGDIKNDKESLNTKETFEGLDDFFEEEWSFKEETSQEFDGLFEEDWTFEKQIDFSSPKRCIIVDIIWEKTVMTLTVKDFLNDVSATVQCSGIW